MQPIMLALIAFGVVVFGTAVSMLSASRSQAQLVPVRVKRNPR